MDSIRYESNKTLEIERERERCTFSILNKKRKVSVKKFKGGIYDTPTKPVSYTHLDVYKRQRIFPLES